MNTPLKIPNAQPPTVESATALNQTDGTLLDDFSTDCAVGKVIGSLSASGQIRQGVDIENVLSIDNGALRIQPLVVPGWARAGIAYGPYPREPGLALGVWLLNGHNNSEGNDIKHSLRARLVRWLRGIGNEFVGKRLWRWAMSRHHRRPGRRQLYRWVRNRRGWLRTGKLANLPSNHLMENLAVGWFSEPVPANPTETGHAIVVRAEGEEMSTLGARISNRLMPALQGLQNVQMYYFVLLREQGAAYYAASVTGAYGLSAYPTMRLLGIDDRLCPVGNGAAEQQKDQAVYAGLYQGALGQVGFRAETRLYGLHAEVLPALKVWYGTAQSADKLVGDGETLEGTAAEVGDRWQVIQGKFHKTPDGLAGLEKTNLALIKTENPTGAIHVRVGVRDGRFNKIPPNLNNMAEGVPGSHEPAAPVCALLWRTQDENNTWALWLKAGECQLRIKENAQWSTVATESRFGLMASSDASAGISADISADADQMNAVQVLDNGDCFSLYLNGRLIFDQWFYDARFHNESQMGVLTSAQHLPSHQSFLFQYLESHPRDIPVPEALKLGAPWQPSGSHILVADDFAGTSQDLAGRYSSTGNQQWQKSIGKGSIWLTGSGSARVRASSERPNPSRLAYTVGWDNPDFADVSVDITSPGTARHQHERGRGGLIFWQDLDNYIIVSHWLDDSFGSVAVCAFFRIDGYEELYDAIWTNLGNRQAIAWGRCHTHRITFDGARFMTYINNEPVLYRSMTDLYPGVRPLAIHRVGIVANWDWGNDTGSTFNRFVAKK